VVWRSEEEATSGKNRGKRTVTPWRSPEHEESKSGRVKLQQTGVEMVVGRSSAFR
jgi:hypothetical protein